MGNLDTKPTRVIRFCSRAEAVALILVKIIPILHKMENKGNKMNLKK